MKKVATFTPSVAVIAASQMTAFQSYCEKETGCRWSNYHAFHEFSVLEFRVFWTLFLRWSHLIWQGAPEPVCVNEEIENAVFFPGVSLNYAENLLAAGDGYDDQYALTSCVGDRPPVRLSRRELREQVISAALAFQKLGIAQGDRVVAIDHNSAEIVVAALAVVAIGACFSSVSPELSSTATLNRFRQLEPALLVCRRTGSLQYTRAESEERLKEVIAGLPSLKWVVTLDDAPISQTTRTYRLRDLLEAEGAGSFVWPRFAFNHPLFILFSSGTTGTPKCIVHGAGGTLLEHVKEHRLHCDLSSADRLFFQTSSGWMMWNWQLSALASKVEIVLYDGPLGGPDNLWQIVSRERVTVFGTNPGFLRYCADARFTPARSVELEALRAILCTGSVLYDEQFDWVISQVKRLPVQSISGGTDIIGCFVLGNPNLPVNRGESQCKSLALDVRAHNTQPGAVGELVCRNPFPSRPVGFYGDRDGSRFHAAYFAQNVGVWTHGDFVEFTSDGAARMHGRSDGVLNVRGIRIGPAEIYRILRNMSAIQDCMAVEQRDDSEPGGSRLVVLVVLTPGLTLNPQITLGIKTALRREGSPAHVPTVVAQVNELPTTHSGKRSEIAARDVLNGREPRNRDALRNPSATEALRDNPLLRPGTSSYPCCPEPGPTGTSVRVAQLIRNLFQRRQRSRI